MSQETGRVRLLVIGGGPVGLWTSIQIKVLLPDIEVIIFERYEEYRRHHVLRISRSSMRRASPHPKLDQLIDHIPRVVRTSTLESALKALAMELGVKIVYRQVSDVNIILQDYPGAVAVIGADGSHSIVRHQIFHDAFRQKQALKYILELKYEITGGEARGLRYLDEFYPTQKLIDFCVTETVGKYDESTEKTAVTIRFVIPGLMYQELKEATFKNPFRLPVDQHRIPPKILEAITIWLNAREYCTGERRIEGSLRISVLHLSVYLAERVALLDEDRQVSFFLVGDAAFGVPFYRSLNNGLICGSKLAVSLYYCCKRDWKSKATVIDSSPSRLPGGSSPDSSSVRWKMVKNLHKLHTPIAGSSLEAYNQFVQVLGTMELAIARAKSECLFFAGLTNRLNASVPWQVNVWNQERVSAFKFDLYPLACGEPVKPPEMSEEAVQSKDESINEPIQWEASLACPSSPGSISESQEDADDLQNEGAI